MLPLTRADRRQLGLSWAGIGLAWGASLGLGLVLVPQWLALLVPAITAGGLVLGAIMTRRVRARGRRASITVGDLRGVRARSTPTKRR